MLRATVTAIVWLGLMSQADPTGGLVGSAALAQGAVVPAPPAGPGAPALPPAGAAGSEIRVTTDTPEYCETLAERVARDERARRDVPEQAAQLAEEGHHMCAQGLIRGGLVRLRRAWVMLRREK